MRANKQGSSEACRKVLVAHRKVLQAAISDAAFPRGGKGQSSRIENGRGGMYGRTDRGGREGKVGQTGGGCGDVCKERSDGLESGSETAQ